MMARWMAALAVAAMCGAAGAVTVPGLPESPCLDTEASTNVALRGWSKDIRHFNATVDFSGTASSNVEVAFGADSDADGVLGVAECDLRLGYDCGEWFVAVGTNKYAAAAEPGRKRLSLGIELRESFAIRSIAIKDGDAIIFNDVSLADSIAPQRWTMFRLVTRGMQPLDESLSVNYHPDAVAIIIR